MSDPEPQSVTEVLYKAQAFYFSQTGIEPKYVLLATELATALDKEVQDQPYWGNGIRGRCEYFNGLIVVRVRTPGLLGFGE